jgi:TolB-like protein
MRDPSVSPALGNASADVAGRTEARVSATDASAELDRILSSPRFQASERRRAFLRFIVDETLAGRGESLKGYTVALAVFRRDSSFDPQADPVVRLEARRLRRDLDSYYMDAGQDDPVRISIPKGSYVPSFEWRISQPVAISTREPALDFHEHSTPVAAKGAAETSRFGLARNALVAAILAVVLATSIWLGARAPRFATPPREAAVLVLPFEALGPEENTRYFATGIGQELISNLSRIASFRLYTSPTGSGPLSGEAPLQIGRSLGVSYVVKGSVQTSAQEVRVIATVLNATSGEIVWARTYARPSELQSLMDTQRELANEIAIAIGQPYGALKNDVLGNPPPKNMESYICVLRALGYRRTFARSGFDPVLQCLEQTVRRDPEYSDAWAMLGWLHVDAARLDYFGDSNRQREYDKALEATSRAINLAPKTLWR